MFEEPIVPRTIADLMEYNCELQVTFQCGRRVVIEAVLLALRFGERTAVNAIKPKLVCAECGARQATVWMLPAYDQNGFRRDNMMDVET